MNIFNAIKEWLIKMLTRSDVKKTYDQDIVISDEMQSAITGWLLMYAGKAPWIDEEKGIHSLRLEQAITREFVNTVLNEMSLNISNAKLSNIFSTATQNLNINLQKGLACGALVIKPLGGDKVQYVSQNCFVPIEYDVNGRLIKVIFPEIKQVGESLWYTRLEYHSLDYEHGLTITNKAFKSTSANTLGREVPLTDITEWANLYPTVTYPDMLRPAFGYYVNPIDNTIDGSHAGVSIFESGKKIIEKIDVQFGRLDWEFESGERAINVDEAALKPTQKIDGLKYEAPKLNERLYRGLNNLDDLYKEFSPQLRQNDFIAGLEEYKRELEFAVGLSYGDISNPQTVDKTATEVKSSKQRKYDTVTAIQNNLKTCLDDLCYALAFYNSLTSSGYDFSINFEDSILTDDDTKRTRDRQDVSMGVMQLWEYRMKWYGEDEETAKKNIAQKADVIE